MGSGGHREEKKSKKDKKEKKEKKERKEKKEKKHDTSDPDDVATTAKTTLAADLVPFALPLADDKTHKKIFKLIKKGAKIRSIHRGVKECEKAIKKCPPKKAFSASSASADVPGLVIIAGDISPMDVILHFPILCEEHGVPYLFIRSRADLGVAACTKRATSVVMLRLQGKPSMALRREGKKGGEDVEMKDADAEADAEADKGSAGKGEVNLEEYQEAWRELVKMAQKQWVIQVEPWVKGMHPKQLVAGWGGA